MIVHKVYEWIGEEDFIDKYCIIPKDQPRANLPGASPKLHICLNVSGYSENSYPSIPVSMFAQAELEHLEESEDYKEISLDDLHPKLQEHIERRFE